MSERDKLLRSLREILVGERVLTALDNLEEEIRFGEVDRSMLSGEGGPSGRDFQKRDMDK